VQSKVDAMAVRLCGEGVAEWLASLTRGREVASLSLAFAQNLYHYDAALMQLSSRLHHCLPWQCGACVTTLVSAREVEQRPSQLVLGWVTVSGIPQPPSPQMGCLLWYLVANGLLTCRRQKIL
jgi:hypothetical protein